MYALRGRINQNEIVTNENISLYEGCNVIITILDNAEFADVKKDFSDEKGKEIARELAGLWKTQDNNKSVEDTVREIRRGRSFDI